MAAPSKAQVCTCTPAEIVGYNPTGGVECCVLLGRGLFDELITRPEKSHLLWRVVVCDLETSGMRRPRPALGRSVTGERKKFRFHNSEDSVTISPCVNEQALCLRRRKNSRLQSADFSITARNMDGRTVERIRL